MTNSLTRIEKSWLRSFFTLPQSIKEKRNKYIQSEFKKPFNQNLKGAQYITLHSQQYFIIWLDHPNKISGHVDLSFRDFSAYGEVPVVLIRQSF